ncbi:TerB family tellurite resistance protein [Phenylobacterium sp.]|uniref:tellurite resistance TerB family protein n=1 Tax=Phenylobacterium sp. TaxID=1871053 RepID=UPI00301BA901
MPVGFLKKLLATTSTSELQPEDARASIAALLVMAARADDHYTQHEIDVIEHALAERFKLDPAAAAQLREEGETAEAEAIDLYQFTRAIKVAVPLEDRVALVETLWRVILSDAERDPHEEALMRQIVDRLGLSPMDSALARQRVAARG